MLHTYSELVCSGILEERAELSVEFNEKRIAREIFIVTVHHSLQTESTDLMLTTKNKHVLTCQSVQRPI